MYKRLLALINQFVYLRQGAFSRAYMGRVLRIDPEFIEVQAYHENGMEAELWTLALSSITEFHIGSKELNALELRVKWAHSPDVDLQTKTTIAEEDLTPSEKPL